MITLLHHCMESIVYFAALQLEGCNGTHFTFAGDAPSFIIRGIININDKDVIKDSYH
jgi:hypothetical protein